MMTSSSFICSAVPAGCRPGLTDTALSPATALNIALLLMLSGLSPLQAADAAGNPVSLEQARELGRKSSRFLNQSRTDAGGPHAIPEANTAEFQETIASILKKSCLACHGPGKSEGRLRVDQLNADLLAGPDVEQWREIFALANRIGQPSELVGVDQPGLVRADG